jgi:hypothetical protein
LNQALEVVNNSTCDAVFKRGIRINEYRTWILRGLGKGYTVDLQGKFDKTPIRTDIEVSSKDEIP